MNRLLLIPLAFVTFAMHSPKPLPMADPIIVSERPLSLFNLSDQRDSLVAREARKQSVPVWLALSIGHTEVWGGDSTAINPHSGAAGLMQIHPDNFGRFPECGENVLNRQQNVCMGITILRLCIVKRDEKGNPANPTLALVLNCYGGATSLAGKRAYNLDVNRRTRLEWLDD